MLVNIKDRASYFKAYQKLEPSFHQRMSGKKFIIFDLETTGFDGSSSQITQIAAAVVDGSTLEVQETFCKRVRLSESNLALLRLEIKNDEYEKKESLHWVLTFNHYHKSFVTKKCQLEERLLNEEMTKEEFDEKVKKAIGTRIKYNDCNGDPVYEEYDIAAQVAEEDIIAIEEEEQLLLSEKEVLQEFASWINEKNVNRFIGHNILNFDCKFLALRMKENNIELVKNCIITDTLWLSRLLFIPVVKALKGTSKIANELYSSLLDQKNQKYLLSTLQDLRKAFNIECDLLSHDASSDIIINLMILNKMIDFLDSEETKELLRAHEASIDFEIFMDRAYCFAEEKDFL